MKFPGRRKSKHYFPVDEKMRQSLHSNPLSENKIFIVGLDQLLVDIEIPVEDSFLLEKGFKKGESRVIDDDLADTLYHYFKKNHKITGEYAGGSVGNTLHNFCILSDAMAITLGAMNENIQLGGPEFCYLCHTSSKVNLQYLQPSEKSLGRALTFITPDHERTFAISKGCMNDLYAESIPEQVIKGASALLISAYVFRDQSSPLFFATLKAAELAKFYQVPVVMGLGSEHILCEQKAKIKDFIQQFVNVMALNKNEATALTGITDPLLCAQELLFLTDLVLLTVGARGLYMAGWCDQEKLRETKDPLQTKSIENYNQFEYSRAMRREDCDQPIKIFTHINPFLGGPQFIKNTNGAGDAALAAVLHDLAANRYHKETAPHSPKHDRPFLSYSSIHQMAKYANRVSFEVLAQSSPRLMRGLPEREDNLEEAYWAT
jgi:inosine kinase